MTLRILSACLSRQARRSPALFASTAFACVALAWAAAFADQPPASTPSAFDGALQRGQYSRAAEIANAAVAKLGSNASVRDARVRAALLDQARMSILAAKWDEAEQRLKELDASIRRSLSKDDAALVPVLRRRALLADRLYEFAAADRHFTEARRIVALGKVADTEVAATLQAVADSLSDQHRWWEATQAREEEIAFLEKTRGPDS